MIYYGNFNIHFLDSAFCFNLGFWITSHLVTSLLVGRLFTPKIASYYEDFYKSKGVNFIKGTALSSFVFNSTGKVNFNLLTSKLGCVGLGIYKRFRRL